MTNIHDKATRQSLINRYMEAETSPAEERMLADYFLNNDTVDKDEQAFAKLIRMERSNATILSQEGVEEYDRMDNAQCTMHNAQCTMHNAQCTMHSSQLSSRDTSLCIENCALCIEERSPRRTLPLRWVALVGGIAACLILMFTLRPASKEPSALDLAHSLEQIMDLPLREITSLTATPIGEYVWIKAQFADGTEETFIMERDEKTDALSLLTVSR